MKNRFIKVLDGQYKDNKTGLFIIRHLDAKDYGYNLWRIWNPKHDNYSRLNQMFSGVSLNDCKNFLKQF